MSLVHTVAACAAVALISGCHGRFKRHVPEIDSVQVKAITLAGPNVNLGRVYTQSGGLAEVGAAVFNITQAVREGNIARHIADKVNPDQVNDQFVAGFRDQLGAGPPFGSHDGAGATIQFELVDWGMEGALGSPGVYNYEVVVRGYTAQGKKMYRTSYQCYADAGVSGWVESTPFAGKNPNQIKNLPAEEIQAVFDASAYHCGRQFVAIMQKHAG